MIYFVFKRNCAIFHIMQGHFQQVPIYLGFHFQNQKHFLKYFGPYLLTTVYTKKQYQKFLFICLYMRLQRQKKFFFLQCSQIAIRLICKRVIFAYFSSNIPLYIAKNPVEKLCKALEMKLKTYTSVGLKFVFEKIKFKVLHYIQLNFNRQRPGLSKVQTSMFKSLVINYFILNYRHTF